MDSVRWGQMVDYFAASMGLSEGQKDGLAKNKVARLVAELPFLAGCEQAERTAYAHLGTLLAAARNPRVFAHVPGESLEDRLFTISSFKGGNRAVIERGMKVLALCSLGDHVRDAEFDAAHGKYNPLNAGAIDPAAEKQRLMREIEANPCPEMSRIVDLNDIMMWWWINLAEPVVSDGVHEQSA
jgi:hypothetical protein